MVSYTWLLIETENFESSYLDDDTNNLNLDYSYSSPNTVVQQQSYNQVIVGSTSKLLSTDGGRHIARDSNGIWYVIYIGEAMSGEVYLTISDDSTPTSFSRHIRLVSQSGGVLGAMDGEYNTIDIDENDFIHIAFRDGGDPNHIYYSKSDTSSGCMNPTDWTHADGETRGAEEICSAPGGGGTLVDPVLWIQKNGDVHIAWARGQSSIEYRKWSEINRLWSDIEIITDDGGAYTRPMIHIDSNNNIHAIWGEGEESYRDIAYSVKRRSSDEWTNSIGDGEKDILYDTDAGNANHPSIIIDYSGLIWAAYEVRNNNIAILYFDTCDLGSSWNGPEMVRDGIEVWWGSLGLLTNGNIILSSFFVGSNPNIVPGFNIHDGNEWSERRTTDYSSGYCAAMNIERENQDNYMGWVYTNIDEGVVLLEVIPVDGHNPPPPPLDNNDDDDDRSSITKPSSIMGITSIAIIIILMITYFYKKQKFEEEVDEE